MEAQVLEILAELMTTTNGWFVPVADITMGLIERYGAEYERPITNRWIGSVLRKKLNLQTHKSHGVYVVPVSESERVRLLCGRYNVNVITDVAAASEEGDVGTSGTL